jgi:hypothetical protein
MDASRFDRLAKRLADRPLNRRAAIAAGGGGLAAIFGLVGSRTPSVAQDATPVASPAAVVDGDPELLFVQAFQAGTWAPKPGEDGTFLLTLSGHTAQTIYFSNRPERLVGTVPTVRLLDSLGFTPTNPPNAAVVTQAADGSEEVLVVELFNPVYTESFAVGGAVTVTYEAQVLAGYQEEGLRSLAERQGDAQLPDTFGPTSLFIDGPNCADETSCLKPIGGTDVEVYATIGAIPGGPYEKCWYWDCFCCSLCSIEQWRLNQSCNDTYPACEGRCLAS